MKCLKNTIFPIKIILKKPDVKSMYAMKAKFLSDGVILYCQLDINIFNHDKKSCLSMIRIKINFMNNIQKVCKMLTRVFPILG